VDRATIEVYERVAGEYARRRPPRVRAEARAFARRVRAGGIRADLGCGPGRYTGDLGEPVVAVDAAAGMLNLVPASEREARLVQADLEALPFRRGGLAGAWANLSYQHVPKLRLPMALAELHGALAVGAPAEVTVIEGDGEGPFPDDDFPGRLFARWRVEELRQVLTGAGFEIEAIRRDTDQLRARLTRCRTLADTVGPGMRLLVCGLNPSIYAADAGVAFARPGNRFWPAAHLAGLVSVERDAVLALRRDGVGLTDLAKRATVQANELGGDEYGEGVERVRRLVEWLRPGAVCFVGLSGWRAALDRRATSGPQAGGFGGVPAYLMPSTSGLNARSRPAELAAHLRAAAALSATPPKRPRRRRGASG
jgi:TDG/mug DNA glycosylase family protein